MKEKVERNIANIRRVYVDISCFRNPDFVTYIQKSKADICLSELTVQEIRKENVNESIKEIVKTAKILKVNNNILKCAKKYIDKKLISKQQYDDALHIAIAKYYKCFSILYDKNVLESKKICFAKIVK